VLNLDQNIVHCASLVPLQKKANIVQIQSSNFHAQYMLKHSGCSEFFTYIDYLYSGLLEGDKDVHSYVPRPFVLRVGKRYFTPSFYVNSLGNKQIVNIASKPLNISISFSLETFFVKHGFAFTQHISDNIIKHQIEALNWLDIVKRLYISRNLDTTNEEREVLLFLFNHGTCRVDDLVDPGDRESSMLKEIATLRLLHKHEIKADLDKQRLHFGTTFWTVH
jgi:hypothetical protein